MGIEGKALGKRKFKETYSLPFLLLFLPLLPLFFFSLSLPFSLFISPFL
jgi:hypothetical protein